jgi:KDO2-lipid IV(A) lauroyltransferase
MRPIDNPWIDRYLRRFRTQTGQTMIPRDRALGEMIRVLQRNKFLIVQVDQDARESGVYVNFFGRPRRPTGAGDAGAQVQHAHRDGQHLSRRRRTASFSDPLYPDAFRDRRPGQGADAGVQRPLRGIRPQHPDQWFWIHDRWKTAERVARTTTEALA